MDDIKGPVPRPRAPVEQEPMEHQEPQEPRAPIREEPERRAEPKSGMKTWLVVFLVVLALIIGAGGVYLWQSANSTADETQALQSQIDKLNQDLSEAQRAAADNTLEVKDKEIETLTVQNTTLTDSNEALKVRNTELTTNCAAEGLDADCKAITTP